MEGYEPRRPSPENSGGGGIICSIAVMKSKLNGPKGSYGYGSGGGSPFMGALSLVRGPLFRCCWEDLNCPSDLEVLGGSKPGDTGVTGDLGVLPPDCEVSGERGGLSSRLGAEYFPLRLSAGLASRGAGEADSMVVIVGAALLSSLAQVTISVFSSVWRSTLPPVRKEGGWEGGGGRGREREGGEGRKGVSKSYYKMT